MARFESLWLDMTGHGANVTVSLAICRNCGKPKVTSNPCSLDHLAAVMEFAAAHPGVRSSSGEAGDPR